MRFNIHMIFIPNVEVSGAWRMTCSVHVVWVCDILKMGFNLDFGSLWSLIMQLAR